ncbi:MAG: hypothetical protein PHR61_03370, partial [Candidatus Absconditabacteria bacterium]|nr:hypothetical protein [Candidatus Absconditabacteria bacterium]
EEPTQPEEEPTQPEEEPTQPEEEPTQPEEEPTQPEEEPTQPEEEPTQLEEEPIQPEEDPTQPEEEPTQPEEEYGFQTTSTCDYSGFSSNISGLFYSGIMNLSWTISSICENETVDIQLYDHNEEWIILESVPGYVTEYNFDTTLLGSGFYLQTGLNASGEIEILNPGLYSGVAINSWTGYYIRRIVQPDTILSQTNEFTIDNESPTISNISLSYSGALSGVVGIGKSLIIEFDASENLTGVNVIISTGQALFSGLSGNHYVYNYILPLDLSSGNIPYDISYQDLAGNIGNMTGNSQLVYDSTYPQITGFNLSGYDFSFTTSEITTATAFVIIKNTTNGWAFSMTGSSTNHMFSLPTLSLNTNYDMGIVVKDVAGNEGKAALELKRNNSGDISYTLLATLYGQNLVTYSSGSTFLNTTGNFELTGQQETIKDQFREEIDKFTQCRNDIEYTRVKIQLKGFEIDLTMPKFQKNEMKKLVNSFILYILKNLENSSLSQVEIEDFVLKFNDFAVILKLIKDDNNECKQNLTNYHLEQFKQSMETYGISL